MKEISCPSQDIPDGQTDGCEDQDEYGDSDENEEWSDLEALPECETDSDSLGDDTLYEDCTSDDCTSDEEKEPDTNRSFK